MGGGRVRVVIVLIKMIMMLSWKSCDGCFEDERIALLQLKSSFHYSSSSSEGSSFYSWGRITSDDNCCEWEGVECSSSSTGRITHLFVRGDFRVTEWKMNASLFFPFQQLTTLSLSGIIFIGGSVHNQGFDRLSALENLESLDLSRNIFKDINSIISSIGRISSLKPLSLSLNWLKSTADIQGLVRLEKLEVLDLSYSNFNSNIFTILSGISSLKSLSLRGNAFTNIKGLDMLSRLEKLESLDLSENYDIMDKSILSSISRLSILVNLEVLDLSSNNFNNNNSLGVLPCVSVLSSLKTLDLSYCGLEGTIDLQELDPLENLETLRLSGNQITKVVASRDIGDRVHTNLSALFLDEARPKNKLQSPRLFNLKDLEYLDTSYNVLDNDILKDIEKLISLKNLRLSGCELSGTLPTTEGLCNLRNLEELRLSFNELSGTLPQCIANLTSLQNVSLSGNHFSGSISTSPLRSLTSLQELYFSNNQFQVPLSLQPFFNHSNLKYLNGENNHIIYDHDDVEMHDSTPKFQLERLMLSGGGNGNGSGFPKFLQHQHDLQYVDLSNIELKTEFPYWLLENNTKLENLNLANTCLSGPLHLPTHSHKYLQMLDISNNGLNGNIPLEFGRVFPRLNELQVDNNRFAGNMPHSLLNCTSLQVLDASNNHLSGRIPGWIVNVSSLQVLDLSENRFSGRLPTPLGPSQIREVYLSENMLRGSLGTAFYNCSELMTLDLSRNNLSGTIPKWIGKLPKLRYLLMSHNNLEGEMPVEICNLEQLSLIDLSNNNLFGHHLLSCIRIGSKYIGLDDIFKGVSISCVTGYMEQPLVFTTKGTTRPFEGSILGYISGIDLSCNNFSGKIPAQIGNLTMIQLLNLSHNSLVGPIPESFSNLTQIESLDLSYNNLDGKIPSQLLGLTSLSAFSVAHNNLSGRTPEMVRQFATFENTSYEGNPFLCGLPLTKSCSPVVPPSPNAEDDEGRFMDMEAFYVSCVISYIVVLCTIAAVLYVNPYWRRRWFNMIKNCYYFIEDNLLFPLFKFRAL